MFRNINLEAVLGGLLWLYYSEKRKNDEGPGAVVGDLRQNFVMISFVCRNELFWKC